MDRRHYLRTVATGVTAGAVAGAGCTELTGGSETTAANPNLKLDKPEELRADPEALPYPAWGQQLPEVALPAALRDTELTTTGFETPLALTFIYTTCQTACPVLTQALKRAQDRATEEDYGDAVSFAEITFDPERDTPDRLREYATERDVDLSADNWYFLRPATVDRAKEVVNEEFGIGFERTTPEEMDQYMFAHSSLILLVNADGYVERSYSDGQDGMQKLPEDMNRLRQA